MRRESAPGRLPQLDGIRGLAAVSVVAFHAMPWPAYLPVGRAAVWVFFVLSGFLITGILLRARGRGGDRKRAWATFYARRSLRIFPIYYLTLIVTALCVEHVRADWFSYATYTSNIPNLWGVVKRGALGHFWSLAVEEQFYLAWPFAVLLVPPRRLRIVMIAMIVTGLVSAAVLTWAWPIPQAALHATPTCLLGLGMGALLAENRHASRSPRRLTTACLAIGLAALASYAALYATGWARPLRISAELAAWTFLSVWLIGRAADGFDGPVGRLLASKPLVALGTISYGIYMYHLPILSSLRGIWPVLIRMAPAQFAVGLTTTLIVAAASWRWIEKPLQRLKDRLPTTEEATAPLPGEADAAKILLEDRQDSRGRALESAIGQAD